MDDDTDAAGGVAPPPEDACLLSADSIAALETLLGRSLDCRLLGGGYHRGRVHGTNLLLTGVAPVSILGHRPWPAAAEPVALWLRLEDTPETRDFTVQRLTVSRGVPRHRTLGRDLDDLRELPLFTVATHLDGIAYVRRIDIRSMPKAVEPQDAREPRRRYDFDTRLEFHYENPFARVRFCVEVEHPAAPGLVVSAAAAAAGEALPEACLHPHATLRRSLALSEGEAEALWAFTRSRPA